MADCSTNDSQRVPHSVKNDLKSGLELSAVMSDPAVLNEKAIQNEEKKDGEVIDQSLVSASLCGNSESDAVELVDEISTVNNNIPFVKISVSEYVSDNDDLPKTVEETLSVEAPDNELMETPSDACSGNAEFIDKLVKGTASSELTENVCDTSGASGSVKDMSKDLEEFSAVNSGSVKDMSKDLEELSAVNDASSVVLADSQKISTAVDNFTPPTVESLSVQETILTSSVNNELAGALPSSEERADRESPSSPEHQSVPDDPSQIPEIPVFSPKHHDETLVRSPSPLDNTLTIDEDRSSPASPVDHEEPSQPSPIIIPEENENSVVAYFPTFEKQEELNPKVEKNEELTLEKPVSAYDHAYSLQGAAEKVESTKSLDTGPVVDKVESLQVEEDETNVQDGLNEKQPRSDEVPKRDGRLKRENRYVKDCRSFAEPDAKKVNGETGKAEKLSMKQRERTLSEIDHNYGIEKRNDAYCWICHHPGEVVNCQSCVRSFHVKCLPSDWKQPELCQCPECSKEEDHPNKLPKSDLYKGFCFAIQRISGILGYETLSRTLENSVKQKPLDILVNPVTFVTIEKRIETNHYPSCRVLLNDFNWVFHNMNILELKGELKLAKLILKTAKQECAEIETCLECYVRANTQLDNWFVEPCQRPHLLVWARLKGYPYWPAKAMRHADDRVDVRFFGAHDRAWVPTKDVYLYSRDIPQQPAKNKRSQNLEDCIDEIENHIVKLKKRFGGFSYHSNKFKFRAEEWDKNLQRMLPNYKPTAPKSTRRQSSVDSECAAKKRKLSRDDITSSPRSEELPIVSVPAVENETQKAPSPIPISKVEVANTLPTPVSSPAASDVTKSPETKESVPSNPPLKIKVKLNSGKRGFATITPDRSPARDERVEKVKKKKRRGSGKRTDAEESEPESKRHVDSTETESNPSAPPTPSVIEPDRVPPFPQAESTESQPVVLPQPSEPAETPSDHPKTPVLDEEIQKLMTGRRSVSLVPKSPKTQSPAPDVQLKQKRTARKSFPSVPKSVVEEIVPEDITIKAEPVDYDETRAAPPVTLPTPSPAFVPIAPKPKAAVPALRAIRPAVTLANIVPVPQVTLTAPITPRTISVRPGLTVRMVASSPPTVRAPVVPIQPAQSDVITVEPLSYSADPLLIKELAKKEGERISTNLQFSIENILSELAASGNPYAQMAKMKVEMHNLKKKFQDQLDAARKAADAKLNDTKNKLLAEKERALASARTAMLIEKKKAVDDAKKKQWCAQCGNEAFMYCCWNTSYCTYRCQQTHWPEHLKTCASTQKDKVPVAPVQPPNQNPVSLLVASQGMTHVTPNAFQTTVSVPQPITVAFGGPLSNANPLLNPNPPGAQKILLLSNGTAANGQFLLRTPTNLTVRPVIGNQVKQ